MMRVESSHTSDFDLMMLGNMPYWNERVQYATEVRRSTGCGDGGLLQNALIS